MYAVCSCSSFFGLLCYIKLHIQIAAYSVERYDHHFIMWCKYDSIAMVTVMLIFFNLTCFYRWGGWRRWWWVKSSMYKDRLWELWLGVSDDTSGCMLKRSVVLYQVISGPYPSLNGSSRKCITCRSETGLLNCQPLCTVEDSDCALLFLLFIAVMSCLSNKNTIITVIHVGEFVEGSIWNHNLSQYPWICVVMKIPDCCNIKCTSLPLHNCPVT